ncbi:MAG: GAF domain-containing protein [Verrucomicrobiota bacterium]|nr:GAF domain-containing protein [Verrucomicrobiota bacterium]
MNKAYRQLEKKYQRLVLLNKISSIASSSLEPPKLLRKLLETAVKATHATSGSIMLVDPNSSLLETEVSINLPKKTQQLKLRPGEGIIGWTVAHGKTLRIDDITKDPRYIPAKSSIRSELSVPLIIKGVVIGVLNCNSVKPSAFSDEDQSLLETIATNTSKILYNAWIFKQGQDNSRKLEILFTIAQTIVSAVNLDEVLGLMAEQATRLLNTPLCSIMLLDENKTELVLKASYGASHSYARKANLKVKESLIGVVVRRQQPLAILDVRVSQRYHHLELAKKEGLVSLLSVPLTYRNETIGAINVYTRHLHRFSNEEIRLLSALASFSAIAIDKARMYEKIVNVEEQLRQNERLSALGLMAAEIAHEIRNPLTVIKMLVHTFQEQFAHDPVHAKDCSMMMDKMNHMNAIVDRVLTFARSSEPDLRPVAVSNIFEDMQLLLRHKLKSHDVTLDLDCPADLAPIPLDRAQIEQALLNLILNALDAMGQGGNIILSGKKTHYSEQDWIEISITDNGPGMSAQLQDKLFQPFLTTRSQGTGLGLAIVQKIVENHQGKIIVESTPKKGSTFRLLFPFTT